MWLLRAASVRRKILIICVISGFAALFLACIALATHQWLTLRRWAVRDMTELVEVVAYNSEASLAGRNSSSAEHDLLALSADASIQAACVYDAKGKQFASYIRPGSGSDLGSQRLNSPGHLIEGGRLYIYKEIIQDGEVLGALYAESSLISVGRDTTQFMTTAMLALLAAGLLIVILSMKMGDSISRPIRDLLDTARRIRSEGDYSVRAPKSGDDELGALTDRFNELLLQVENQDNALIEARDHVERDVEERTAKLKAAKELAEDATRAKSEFLANISHELRTPMHAILSFASLGVKKGATLSGEKAFDYFEKIHQAGDRLLLLLNGLFDLSRLEAGRMSFRFGACNIGPLIESVVDGFQTKLAERSVSIRSTGKCTHEIICDGEKIVQVLRSVLDNAVKFSRLDGTIEIQAATDGAGLTVAIRDHGPGIPDDEREEIFEKFVQSRKTKSGAGGAGLGLAICREIIAAHKGRIWAENHAEGGAVVAFWLPLDPAAIDELHFRNASYDDEVDDLEIRKAA